MPIYLSQMPYRFSPISALFPPEKRVRRYSGHPVLHSRQPTLHPSGLSCRSDRATRPLIGWLCLLLMAIVAPGFGASIALDSASNVSWRKVLTGSNFDFPGDQQATATDLDLVGNATHASLYTFYDTTADELYFRVRLEFVRPPKESCQLLEP